MPSDLPPIIPDKNIVKEIHDNLPELPRKKKIRFMKEYKITLIDAGTLTDDSELAEYFEESLKNAKSEPKMIANVLLTEFMGQVNLRNMDITKASAKVPPNALKELVDFVGDGNDQRKAIERTSSRNV